MASPTLNSRSKRLIDALMMSYNGSKNGKRKERSLLPTWLYRRDALPQLSFCDTDGTQIARPINGNLKRDIVSKKGGFHSELRIAERMCKSLVWILPGGSELLDIGNRHPRGTRSPARRLGTMILL